MIAALLTLAMALGVMPLVSAVALAEEPMAEKTVECLGTSGITATDHKFSGSYVYYGKYDGTNPTKYRVLDNETEAFGGRTMLLDCDSILAQTQYHTSSNAWNGSTLQGWVQGESFLTKSDNFSTPESDAIAQSTKNGEGNEGLNEKTFVLSVSEVYNYYKDDNARAKYGGNWYWWLRSVGNSGSNAAVVKAYGIVLSDGWSVTYGEIGASPAFNVNLSSVIFSSLVPGTTNEYKLTLKDADLGAAGTAALGGAKATVTYGTTGGATQASYLVTDQQWDDGWPEDTELLAYGRLGEAGENQTGEFTLPDGCDPDEWDSSYFVYVLAEAVSDGNATDCASVPSPVAKPETYAVSVAANPDGGGSAQASPDRASAGVKVDLEAEAATGYSFAGWTLDPADTGATIDDTASPATTLTVGTADVTAIASFKRNTVAVTGVTVDPATATLAVGETRQLTATVVPDDATDRTVSPGKARTRAWPR